MNSTWVCAVVVNNTVLYYSTNPSESRAKEHLKNYLIDHSTIKDLDVIRKAVEEGSIDLKNGRAYVEKMESCYQF